MYLVDTNALLFSMDQTERLTAKARKILETEDVLYISMASIWEIEIKRNLDKLKIPYTPEELAEYCVAQGYSIVDIKVSHISELANLPKIHNDPFDRLIICQAIAEGFSILTSDSIIPKCPVKTVW